MMPSSRPPSSRADALRHLTTRLVVDLRQRENLYFIVLALLLLIVFPTCLDRFRLNLWGKYLTYAFVSLGLVLCWGYSGVLGAVQELGVHARGDRRRSRRARAAHRRGHVPAPGRRCLFRDHHAGAGGDRVD